MFEYFPPAMLFFIILKISFMELILLNTKCMYSHFVYFLSQLKVVYRFEGMISDLFFGGFIIAFKVTVEEHVKK